MVNLMTMGMHPTFGFPSHIQPMQLSPYAPPHLPYNYPPHYPHPFNDYSSHSPHCHSTSHCLNVASSDGPNIPPLEFPSLEEWFSQLDADWHNFPQSQKFQQYIDPLANMGIDHLDVLYQVCKEHCAKGLTNLDLGIPFGHTVELYSSMEKEMEHISKSSHISH